jgi:hypothetical protein
VDSIKCLNAPVDMRLSSDMKVVWVTNLRMALMMSNHFSEGSKFHSCYTLGLVTQTLRFGATVMVKDQFKHTTRRRILATLEVLPS